VPARLYATIGLCPKLTGGLFSYGIKNNTSEEIANYTEAGGKGKMAVETYRS